MSECSCIAVFQQEAKAMKLMVGDMEAFEQWKQQAIKAIPVENEEEDEIRLLDVQKLSSLPLEISLKEVEVLSTTSIKEVIRQVIGERPVVIEGSLGGGWSTAHLLYCLSASEDELESSKTLADYDIQDGDLLLLEEVMIPPADMAPHGFAMTSRNLVDFCSMVRTQKDLENHYAIPSRDFAERPVESVLLYTDEDTELAKYIRYNFSALDAMTADHLNMYMIEQPTRVGSASAGEYWKARLDQATYSFLQLMGWTRYKPYDKALAYQVADILGVYLEALPCIIIKEFGSRIKSDEKIVVTISGDNKTFFRGLSTIVRTTTEKLIVSRVDPEAYFGEFKKLFIENWNSWKKATEESKTQTTSFIFEGKTVFINKPSGQYEIKDFQNG